MRSTCSSVNSAPFAPAEVEDEVDADAAGAQDTSSGSDICGSGGGGWLEAAGHDGAAGGGAGASHGEGDDDEEAGDSAAFSRSSKLIFGKPRVSPLNAAGSSHGDEEEAGGGAGVAAACLRLSRFIFGNARVSPLNCSAAGGAPKGESSIDEDEGGGNARVSPVVGAGSFHGDEEGGGGGAGAGCAGICAVDELVELGFGRLSKFIFGNARVSPLNCSAG